MKAGTVLKITEQHDWTQVFADGKLLGRLDRRGGEQELTLPALKAGTQLDLLVEAMGRVNFDKSIHDRKGITEKVELVNGKNADTMLQIQGQTFLNYISYLHFSTFFDRGKGNGFLRMKTFHTVYSFVHF